MNCARVTVVLVALTILAGVGEAPGSAQEPPRMHHDTMCGPRCLQMILAQYGIEADLIELIKETQWPAIEKGASLAALERALRKRGIFTCALRIEPQAELSWPHPVLVHLAGDDANGHYVVWIKPAGAGHPVVWDWLRGTRAWDEETAASFSGHVLLTSSAPIDTPVDAVRSGSWKRATVFVIGSILLAFAACLTIMAASRRIKRNHSQAAAVGSR